jgi:hypothetical protein
MTKTTATFTTQIDEAITTPTESFLCEVADRLGITDAQLKERLASKLDNDDPLDWETIPVEHQPLVEAIQRDLDAERSTRKLTAAEEAPQQQEIPPLVEEPTPRRRGRPRKEKPETTALTQRKASKLKESDQSAQKLAVSDQEVKVALHARKGQKSGAQLATVELAAEDLTYRKIKGEALTRKVGQLSAELASEAGFDPIAVLENLGIDSNTELFESLRAELEPALGKLQTATGEIVANAWVNGVDLTEELGNLESLLNSNGYTEPLW